MYAVAVLGGASDGCCHVRTASLTTSIKLNNNSLKAVKALEVYLSADIPVRPAGYPLTKVSPAEADIAPAVTWTPAVGH